MTRLHTHFLAASTALLAAVVPLSAGFPGPGDSEVRTADDLHLTLRRSSPPAGSTVEQVPEVRFWFSEAPQSGSTAVTITGPGNSRLSTSTPAPDAEDDKVIFVTVEGTVAPGSYEVAWRTLAQDGHVIRGDFRFTVSSEGSR